MTTRRSFFKRIAAMTAIVALAPQLCFRTKFEQPSLLPFQESFVGILEQVYQIAKVRTRFGQKVGNIEVYTDDLGESWIRQMAELEATSST